MDGAPPARFHFRRARKSSAVKGEAFLRDGIWQVVCKTIETANKQRIFQHLQFRTRNGSSDALKRTRLRDQHISDISAQSLDVGGEIEAGREFLKLRSEEHTSELQSLMRNSYAVFC